MQPHKEASADFFPCFVGLVVCKLAALQCGGADNAISSKDSGSVEGMAMSKVSTRITSVDLQYPLASLMWCLSVEDRLLMCPISKWVSLCCVVFLVGSVEWLFFWVFSFRWTKLLFVRWVGEMFWKKRNSIALWLFCFILCGKFTILSWIDFVL